MNEEVLGENNLIEYGDNNRPSSRMYIYESFQLDFDVQMSMLIKKLHRLEFFTYDNLVLDFIGL